MHVEYMDHSGSDILVVNAARASFGKESSWEIVEFWGEDGNGAFIDKVKMLSPKDAKLINYLAAHKHVLPFRHPHLTLRCKAPLFVARQLMKHQVGFCLAADTKVTFVKVNKGTSNGTRQINISDLYRMWSGQIKYQGGDKGRRNVRGSHVRVYNEATQRFETSHIVDVLYSGVKDVYELTTGEGLSVKASADHRFLTSLGWKKLRDIQVGDLVISDRAGESFAHDVGANRNLDKHHRERFASASEAVCTECGSTSNLEVDHIEPVWRSPHRALDYGNMQMLCEECHVVKSSTERKRSPNLRPKYSEVVDIAYCGAEDTYDLSIDRIHNFVANGVVVHNSWSEESRRYIKTEPEFYWPDKWRKAADNVKQGSSDEVVDASELDYYIPGATDFSPEDMGGNMLGLYNQMLEAGVAPEMARMILPQNMYTTWVWTGSLLAWVSMLKQRLDSHTQKETRDFAEMVEPIVRKYYPHSYEALMNNEQ